MYNVPPLGTVVLTLEHQCVQERGWRKEEETRMHHLAALPKRKKESH